MLGDRRFLRVLAAVTIAAWLGCTDRDEGDASEESGVGPGEIGFCWKLCEEPVDCCALLPAGAEDCYAMNGDLGLARFVCNAGQCEFDGCASDEEYQTSTEISEYVCHAPTDGSRPVCAVPCTVDTDCTVLPGDFVCGELFDGFAACVTPPCVSDADCPGSQFHCSDNACVFVDCMTDDDCENGGSCNENHECRCTHTSECRGTLDCIPVPT